MVVVAKEVTTSWKRALAFQSDLLGLRRDGQEFGYKIA